MFSRLKQLFIKEFLELFRDPRMRMIILVFPVIQIVVLAQAFVLELKGVQLGILDHSRSVLSRDFISTLSSGEHFVVKEYLDSEEQIKAGMDSGKFRAVLKIPENFSTKVLKGEVGKIQIITDGTNSNDAGLIQGYASMILGTFLEKRNPSSLVVLDARAWFNPNFESRFYYVPGLVGIMLVLISFLLASIAIVKEKEAGTIEQLMVTPITRFEFIIGKTLPYLGVGCITMTIMLLAAFTFYGITVKGSWLLIYLSTAVFVCGNLGGALFISVISSTQQQALLTSFFFMLPSVMLSGLLFPIRNMPDIVQYLTCLNPLRWFLQVFIGVIVKGSTFGEVWQPLLIQCILAVLFISIAGAKFKKVSD